MLRASARSFFRVAIYHAGVALERCARRRAVRRLTGGMDAVDLLKRVALKAEALVKGIRKAPAAAAAAATPEHAAAHARRLGDARGVVVAASVILLAVGSVDNVAETCQQVWAWIQDEWEVLQSGTLRIEDVPSVPGTPAIPEQAQQ